MCCGCVAQFIGRTYGHDTHNGIVSSRPIAFHLAPIVPPKCVSGLTAYSMRSVASVSQWVSKGDIVVCGSSHIVHFPHQTLRVFYITCATILTFLLPRYCFVFLVKQGSQSDVLAVDRLMGEKHDGHFASYEAVARINCTEKDLYMCMCLFPSLILPCVCVLV